MNSLWFIAFHYQNKKIWAIKVVQNAAVIITPPSSLTSKEMGLEGNKELHILRMVESLCDFSVLSNPWPPQNLLPLVMSVICIDFTHRYTLSAFMLINRLKRDRS